MRCKETTGFLLLRRCENVATYQCSVCNKDICAQHAVDLATERPVGLGAETMAPTQLAPPAQVAAPPQAAPDSAVPVGGQAPAAVQPAAPSSGIVCPTCLRRGGIGQGRPADDLYPYYYPYFGFHSYRPYAWDDYSDRDRSVFDRDTSEPTGAGSDVLSS